MPTASGLEMPRLLWQLGPATGRQVRQAALAGRPDMADATALRLLQPMHAKGLLTRGASQRAHGCAPAQAALRGQVTRKERAQVQAMLDREP